VEAVMRDLEFLIGENPHSWAPAGLRSEGEARSAVPECRSAATTHDFEGVYLTRNGEGIRDGCARNHVAIASDNMR